MDMYTYLREAGEIDSVDHIECKLDPDTIKKISEYPYLMIKSKVICTNSDGNIMGFFHNDKFSELTKVVPSLCYEEEGWETLNCLESNNWMKFYLLY